MFSAFDHAKTQQHATMCNRMSDKCCMLHVVEKSSSLTGALARVSSYRGRFQKPYVSKEIINSSTYERFELKELTVGTCFHSEHFR